MLAQGVGLYWSGNENRSAEDNVTGSSCMYKFTQKGFTVYVIC